VWSPAAKRIIKDWQHLPPPAASFSFDRVALLMGAVAFAGVTASISGTVQDASGAAVAGAAFDESDD
jgi:hypothetical protein